ncbi:MAG: hypothetical protein JJE30_15975 [Desulfuromonadales bacterium]|nr:hypothetical protein [Desulfuromonadales bacterium]
MAWDVKNIDGNTVIDGVIQNIRYSTMEDIEVWVALLDAKGKTLWRSVDFVIPRQMDMNDTSTFSVKLKSAATHGAKLVFTYKYSGFEGGGHDNGGGVNWTQSFESKIP